MLPWCTRIIARSQGPFSLGPYVSTKVKKNPPLIGFQAQSLMKNMEKKPPIGFSAQSLMRNRDYFFKRKKASPSSDSGSND
jgi:hypothetical protein